MVGTMVNKKEKKQEEDAAELVFHKDPATQILENKFAHHPIHLLSGGQMFLGVLAVLSQLVVSFSNDVHLNLYTINEGIFCGVVFFMTGSFGLYASYRLKQSNVTAFLVSNICSSVFSIIFLLLSCCLLGETLWYQEEDGYGSANFLVLKTFLSLEIVVSILELTLSITCASLCSKSCCFNDAGTVSAHNYPVVPVKMFSGLQILVGVCSILFFIFLFTLSFDARHTLTFEEIYCGFVFIGIGIFGFYTVKKISVTSLTPFMVLNIFGCLFAGLLIILALVRIYMLDKVEQKFVTMKQEDLEYFPKLNCTKDVLESIHDKRFTTASPEHIRTNIEHCEKMKRDAIEEAQYVLASGGKFGGPRKIYQMEIALALFEAFATVICASFCCRACCCCGERDRGDSFPRSQMVLNTTTPYPGENEQQKSLMVDRNMQEYNEYRK